MKSRVYTVLPAALWVVLCAFISFLIQRQAMEPIANWYPYLPLMQSIQDPSLFPADDFVPLLRRTPSWFWWVMGQLVPAENPYPWLFVMNVVTRLATIGLAFAAAEMVAGDRRAGYLAAFLFSGPIDTLAGQDYIHWAYFTHTALSVPLVLLILTLLLRHRQCGAFALTGLLWNIHLLKAAFMSVALGGYLFFQRKRVERRQLLGCIGLGMVLALPIVPSVLRGLSSGGGDPLWFEHLLQFHRRLLSPFSSQPPGVWVRLSGYLVLFLWMGSRLEPPFRRSLVWGVAAMWAVLYSLGIALAEWHPVSLVIQLQPFRCTHILVLLFLVIFAAEVFRGLKSGRGEIRALHALLLNCVYLFNLQMQPGIFLNTVTALWLAGVALKIWLEWKPEEKTKPEVIRWQRALCWGSLVFLFCLMAVFNLWVLRYAPQVMLAFAGYFWLARLWAFFVLAFYLAQRFRPEVLKFQTEKLARMTAIVLVILGVDVAQRSAGLGLRGMERSGRLLFESYDPAFFDTAHWCREHTPPDALVIAPPGRGGFRAESLRSVYVAWDEHHALMVAPDYVPEFDRRCRLLGYDPLHPQRPWRPGPEQILAAAEESGADYLVMPGSRPMPFQRLYSNEGFTVYSLP